MQTWTSNGTVVERVVCYAYGMGNNSYLLYQEGQGSCIVVDPAGTGEELLAALAEKDLTPVWILLTHGHFDHIRGISALEERFGVIPIAVHEGDAAMLTNARQNMSLPFTGHGLVLHEAERLLSDGEAFEAVGVTLRVLHTPGHSEGSVCFLVGDLLLTGDTLFRLGAGRSDMPGGDVQALIRSLGMLFALPGEYVVLPGHEKESQLSFERTQNTFMKYYAPQLLRE